VELFSSGTVYYKEQPIIIPDITPEVKIPVGLVLLNFEAFINDAEMRNSTFLNILKEGFKKGVNFNI
jgi:hypothetical protein